MKQIPYQHGASALSARRWKFPARRKDVLPCWQRACLRVTSMLFVCHKYAVYKTQVCCLCVTSMLFACHKAVGKRQNDGGSGGHRCTAQENFLHGAGKFPARRGRGRSKVLGVTRCQARCDRHAVPPINQQENHYTILHHWRFLSFFCRM